MEGNRRECGVWTSRANHPRHVRSCDVSEREATVKEQGIAERIRGLSARCEEGRCPTQTFRGTRGPSGCGTPAVGQAPDGNRLATNRIEMESMR